MQGNKTSAPRVRRPIYVCDDAEKSLRMRARAYVRACVRPFVCVRECAGQEKKINANRGEFKEHQPGKSAIRGVISEYNTAKHGFSKCKRAWREGRPDRQGRDPDA